MDYSWLEGIAAKIFVVDANLDLIYVNPAGASELGGAEKITGKNIMDCHNETSRKMIMQFVEKFKNGARETISYIQKREDGTHRLRVYAPLVKDGQYAGMVEMLFKVEGQKDAQL